MLNSSSNLVPFEGNCTAIVLDVMTTDGLADELLCKTRDGVLLNIQSVDGTWIRQKRAAGELISGKTVLEVPPGTMIDTQTYQLELSSPPGLLNSVDAGNLTGQRQLRKLAITGSKTVLVVRIKARDATTTSSENQLADDIFGINGDKVNMKSQYKACSYDKFEVNPAEDRTGATTSIQNGVVTLELDVDTSDGFYAMTVAANSTFEAEYGTTPNELADYVMYCLPPGTTPDATIAFALPNDFRSWYNDLACTYVSAQMHEIGHSIVGSFIFWVLFMFGVF